MSAWQRRRSTARAGLTVAVAALGLAACASGPAYTPPLVDPGEWLDTAVQTAAVDPAWWEQFGDETLTRYVRQAQEKSFDVRIARARLEEALARRGAARSVFWPTVGANAGYAWAEQSINSPQGASSLISAGFVERDNELWQAGVEASWEIDLFGGNRRLNEAAEARVEQTDAQRDAITLAVVAEVASSYMELRGAQRRLEIAERNIALQRQTKTITERKVRAGLAPELDALRAAAQLAASEAQVPALQTAIRAAGYRLGVLTGEGPDALITELLQPAPLPALPDRVALGLRADLLRRRPDVRAAERGLAAAAADIGVAQAEFFPRLVLGAAGGFESGTLGRLAEGNSRLLAIAPSLSVPLFTAGRLRSNKDAALARADAALGEYQKAVAEALADAETAVAAYTGEGRSRDLLTAARVASSEAARISQGLYDKGLGDFLSLLDAERQLARTEDAQVQSDTRLRLALVRVYKSLGGAWPVVAQ